MTQTPLKDNKRLDPHRCVRGEVSNIQGTTENCISTSKVQCQKVGKDTGIEKTNALDICQAANSAKVEEVGTSPLPNTVMTRTTNKVGSKTQGSNKSVAPNVHKNVTNTKASITSCSSNNQITLSGNHMSPVWGVKTQLFPLLCLTP